ncbi:MAG: histidine kinase [Clostridiaceae bacterium]|nr:histidine kinase [Clostridiaceae bacterium]
MIKLNVINRIINIRNFLSLRNKLIIAYILIIAIPIIVVSVFGLMKYKSYMLADVISESRYELQLEIEHINSNKETMEGNAQMVLGDSSILSLIGIERELTVEELTDFNNNTLKNIMRIQFNNPNISDINLFVNNKNITLEMWPLLYSEDRIYKSDWYNKVISKNGKECWYLNHDDKDIDLRIHTDQGNMVSLYTEIRQPKSKHLGILKVNMPTKVFFQKMYSNDTKAKSQLFIIDGENTIFTNENTKLFKDEGMDRNFLKNQFMKYKGTNADNFVADFNGKNSIVVFKYIKSLNAYILSVSSVETSYKYIKSIQILFIIGTVFLIFILSIVTYFITSMILKQLKSMIQSMKKMQLGDFNIDINERSNDEIGELAHNFRKMLRKINELILDAVEKKSLAKETELRSLQTQIDAHFIYNVLENIKMMAEMDEKYLISDSLTSLGSMMRYNMKWEKEYINLSHEITHIKNYISLMNIRFDNNIELDLDIQEGLLEHEVLKMSIQPIIENCIKHALIKIIRTKKGNISLSVKSDGNIITVIVIDNGIGMSPEWVEILNNWINGDSNRIIDDEKESTGIGLRNVNERIKLYYGEQCGITVHSEIGFYTKVIMTMLY